MRGSLPERRRRPPSRRRRETCSSPLIGQIPFPPACLQAGIDSAEADYAAALASIPNGVPKTAGIQLGQAAAAAILAIESIGRVRHAAAGFCVPEGTRPGEYRFTPGVDFAFAPGWGNVTPFVLNHAAQFRANKPYNVTSKKDAADFNEVKAIGGDDITTPSARTADQTQIGLFWLESSPLAWNRLARPISESRALHLWENARLFGLLNLSLADGYIASWESKYLYNFWRPVTAIQTADTDGNPDTRRIPRGRRCSSRIPSLTTTRATVCKEAQPRRALKQFFGTDDIAFSACSLTLPAGERCTDASPVFRSYTSFSQAADENGLSRILVGIHFRNAVEEGIQHGRNIAKRAANLLL